MKQQSFAAQGVFEKYGRKSRREQFLDEMEAVVSWSAMESQHSSGAKHRPGMKWRIMRFSPARMKRPRMLEKVSELPARTPRQPEPSEREAWSPPRRASGVLRKSGSRDPC